MSKVHPAPILSSVLDGHRGTLSEDAVRAKMGRRDTAAPGRVDADASGIREHKSSQAVTYSSPAVSRVAAGTSAGEIETPPKPVSPVAPSEAHALFLQGHDTAFIAKRLKRSEASIHRDISQSRSRLKGLPSPYRPYLELR